LECIHESVQSCKLLQLAILFKLHSYQPETLQVFSLRRCLTRVYTFAYNSGGIGEHDLQTLTFSAVGKKLTKRYASSTQNNTNHIFRTLELYSKIVSSSRYTHGTCRIGIFQRLDHPYTSTGGCFETSKKEDHPTTPQYRSGTYITVH
jgi:hypothetical protein